MKNYLTFFIITFTVAQTAHNKDSLRDVRNGNVRIKECGKARNSVCGKVKNPRGVLIVSIVKFLSIASCCFTFLKYLLVKLSNPCKQIFILT